MQLHVYPLEAVVGLLVNAGFDRFYMETWQKDEFQSAMLYGQRRR